jgi:O-antigen/teichoic acid export membrane protein
MSIARSVVKNVTVLSIGQFIILPLGIVYTVILARYLGPSGYGMYAFAYSSVNLLMFFVNLGMSNLSIRNISRSRDQAAKYLANVVFFKIVLAFITFSAFFIVAKFMGQPLEILLLILVAGVSLVVDALSATMMTIFYAFERMEYEVLGQVARSAVVLGVGVGAVLLNLSVIQIVAVSIAGDIVRAILSFILLSRKVIKPRLDIDIGFCLRLAIDSLPFALLIIVTIIDSDLNVVMLGALKNKEELGWYSAAMRILSVLLIAPTMILQSIYPVLSKLFATSRESFTLSYRKFYQWGLILGPPMAVGTFMLADQVVPLIFGARFENVISLVKVLSFVIAVSFCNNINGATLTAMGKEKLFSVISLIAVISVATINWVMIPRLGSIWVAFMQGAVTGLGFIIYSVMCHHALNIVLPWKTALKTTMASLVMSLCVYCLLLMGINVFVSVLFIAPIIYGVVLCFLRVFSYDDVTMFKQVLKIA